MASKYIQKFPIPDGFPEILHDLSKEILRNQPEDIVEFCALYFKCMQEGAVLDYSKKGKNIPCDFKTDVPVIGQKIEERSVSEKGERMHQEALERSRVLSEAPVIEKQIPNRLSVINEHEGELNKSIEKYDPSIVHEHDHENKHEENHEHNNHELGHEDEHKHKHQHENEHGHEDKNQHENEHGHEHKHQHEHEHKHENEHEHEHVYQNEHEDQHEHVHQHHEVNNKSVEKKESLPENNKSINEPIHSQEHNKSYEELVNQNQMSHENLEHKNLVEIENTSLEHDEEFKNSFDKKDLRVSIDKMLDDVMGREYERGIFYFNLVNTIAANNDD
jgi:hypothetical protein